MHRSKSSIPLRRVQPIVDYNHSDDVFQTSQENKYSIQSNISRKNEEEEIREVGYMNHDGKV